MRFGIVDDSSGESSARSCDILDIPEIVDVYVCRRSGVRVGLVVLEQR